MYCLYDLVVSHVIKEANIKKTFVGEEHKGNLKRNRVLKLLMEVIAAPNQAIRPSIVWNIEGIV